MWERETTCNFLYLNNIVHTISIISNIPKRIFFRKKHHVLISIIQFTAQFPIIINTVVTGPQRVVHKVLDQFGVEEIWDSSVQH